MADIIYYILTILKSSVCIIFGKDFSSIHSHPDSRELFMYLLSYDLEISLIIYQ